MMARAPTYEVIAYIGVGSNIEPEKNILLAVEELRKQVAVLQTSEFYRTASLRDASEPCFANGVWRIETPVSPMELKFDILRKIESRLGRERSEDKFAPRTIDLDLILYGDEQIDEPGLRVPDDDIVKRPFIAVPLLELCAELIIPGARIPLAQLPVANETESLEHMPELSKQIKQRIASNGSETRSRARAGATH